VLFERSHCCRECTMRYTKIVTAEDGGSRFVDAEVEQAEAVYVENNPPVLVSSPLAAEAVVFVTTRELRTDARDAEPLEPHRAPRRQFVICLDGDFEIETTDGERRTFSPGSVVLVEDTTGRGHVTRPSKSRASFVAVPLT
jgi:hypothetical protein